MDLEDRSRRIVDSAVELAEQGGFEAVRLRDVASHAGVALGTLYRRFRSKEDLLVAAFEREMVGLEERVLQRLPEDASHVDRLGNLFALVTRNFCRKPNLARALLKALVSGDPELAARVAELHRRFERLIVAALRGAAPGEDEEPCAEDRTMAWSMNLVWFGLIIGWASGVNTQPVVVEKTREAARLMLDGWKSSA
jgi:AcrR family transcriptional regulator